jgi:hypothetical protein
MKRALFSALALLALSVTSALAFTLPTASAGPGQYAVSITAVTTFTVPQYAAAAEICVETAGARYTDDGTTPTSSVGIPVAAGQCFAYGGPLSAFKIIGAGAMIDVSYYK